MIDTMLGMPEILAVTEGFHRTSTINNIKDKSTVFVKSERWLHVLIEKVMREDIDVVSFCAKAFWKGVDLDRRVKSRIRPMVMDNVVETFILYHNEVNRHRQPMANEYASDCKIHPSVWVGGEGMRWIRGENGPVGMKHMGNVVFKSGVEIDAYSSVKRGTIDSTLLGRNVKIGTQVSIGHNVVIGKSTFVTPGVIIGGSAVIGKNCWVGMGSVIRDNVEIVDRVKIGMGSLVVRDLTEPGLYYGSPATRKGDWDGKL